MTSETEPPRFSHAQIRTIMLGVTLALFLASLDQTIVATALPAIAQDLGGWDQIAWVVTAYLIASTVTTPIYGRLSDLFGRRPVLLVSVSIFVAGAMLAALAPTMGWLIAARIVQGLGGGGLRSVAIAVVSDILPPRERGRYQGYLSTTFATANVVGPVLGGVLSDSLSWHWIFWINLPLGALAFSMTWYQLRRLPRPTRRPVIDWLGAALILAATTPLLLGISAVQRTGSWGSAETLTGFAVGGAFLVALVLWELRVREPMLPMRLFANSIFAYASVVTLLTSTVMIALILIIPLHYQLLVGLAPGAAGIRLIAMTLGTVSGSFVAGQLITKTGRTWIFPVIGCAGATAGCMLLAVLGLGHTLVVDLAVTMLLGLSLGGQMSPLTVTIQNALEPRDAGVGLSCMMFFRLMGGAFGTAGLVAVLVDRLGGGLALFQPHLRAAMPVAELRAMGTLLTSSFAHVYWVSAGIMALATVAACAIRELPLRGK
ncbi:MAG: Drug resistance transporter, EmrB/QacA subfamily [Rhodospirillales bacterium]|nr:Drug resistance transporter, EmrB/QacA subfamily [Rhodospirillales bacterium]